MTVTNGRKSSSRSSRWPFGRPVTTVGSTKCPGRAGRPPPAATSPSRRASPTAVSKRADAHLVDDGAEERVAIGRVAELEAAAELGDPLDELVVHLVQHDRP